MKNSPDALLVFSHLTVQNVNSVSSPITWGFPSISAILGFVHALERKLKTKSLDLTFSEVGVVCHHFSAQVFRSHKYADFSFCLTRNPLEKNEKPASIQQESRAHIEISIIIPIFFEGAYINDNNRKNIASEAFQIAQTLRIAGGSIFLNENTQAELLVWPSQFNDQKKESQKLLRKMLPGFALISGENLLTARITELQAADPNATAFDALLEFSSLNFKPCVTDIDNPPTDKVEWEILKKPGWIVPIPIGYQAISDLYQPGTVLNARDNTCPFRFVENIYSLGQWISPHRIGNIHDIFWHYQFEPEKGLYRCVNLQKS